MNIEIPNEYKSICKRCGVSTTTTAGDPISAAEKLKAKGVVFYKGKTFCCLKHLKKWRIKSIPGDKTNAEIKLLLSIRKNLIDVLHHKEDSPRIIGLDNIIKRLDDGELYPAPTVPTEKPNAQKDDKDFIVMDKKTDSSLVNCLRKALSEIDEENPARDDLERMEMIIKQFCKVGFGSTAMMRDKIESLKFMAEVLRQDIEPGMGITQMEELIIDRGIVGFDWLREVEPKEKVSAQSRVACLYGGKVYMIGKIVQFKHSEDTHIVENQLTGELYEWQASECKRLSISECISWINHMNTSLQPGLALPQGHIDKLKLLHKV